MCGDEPPRIRCHQCGASQYLCRTCDSTVHEHQPLHDREIWCDGIFKAVPPTTVISCNTERLATQSMNIHWCIDILFQYQALHV